MRIKLLLIPVLLLIEVLTGAAQVTEGEKALRTQTADST